MSEPTIHSLDKKLDVLIGVMQKDVEANTDFRRRTEMTMAKLEENQEKDRAKIVDIEKKQAIDGVNINVFSDIKKAIIKWVVGGMFTIISVAGILATIVIKGAQ